MKIFLFGGGYHEDNEELDFEILSNLNNDNPTFTFIPSSYDNFEEHYEEFVENYSLYGISNFHLFHADLDYAGKDKDLEIALQSDFIFLAGGNTYYFLHHLRKSKILRKLIQYVKRGGLLGGLSAGGIIMGETILPAGYPYFDCDENEINLVDLRGMGLYHFEFFPHYTDNERYRKALIKESRFKDHPIYAIGDGSGVTIIDEKISFIGDCYIFFQGKYLEIF